MRFELRFDAKNCQHKTISLLRANFIYLICWLNFTSILLEKNYFQLFPNYVSNFLIVFPIIRLWKRRSFKVTSIGHNVGSATDSTVGFNGRSRILFWRGICHKNSYFYPQNYIVMKLVFIVLKLFCLIQAYALRMKRWYLSGEVAKLAYWIYTGPLMSGI